MSTIRVDSFGPAAGGTTYSARGIAKAWVNFNGTGTIAARDSENVSSLTDNDTGQYTVNISNAFDAADYAFTGTKGRTAGQSGVVLPQTNVAVPTVSACRIVATAENWSGQDDERVVLVLYGDLA